MVLIVRQGLSEVSPGGPGQEVPFPGIFVERSTKSIGGAMPSPSESNVQSRRNKSPNVSTSLIGRQDPRCEAILGRANRDTV